MPQQRSHKTRSRTAEPRWGNQTVHKLWMANGIKPHIRRAFKISNDKRFEAKFRDVIGLYHNTPDRALACAVTRRASARPWREPNPASPWASQGSRRRAHGTALHFDLVVLDSSLC